ncbi:DUF2917 domain-containing protein [Paraburkholderia guartelaensis]|uniref:DUF2917 domain-containing protein n=1 Tax=Paraburkholderia guartelaensis TaxID=2546446 RepID=UPI002AB655D7|nr:DUF2917 domain-containing protein [Paraburkholderia guartelaensis]
MTESPSFPASCDTRQRRARWHHEAEARHKIVVHLDVLPGQTLQWRADADSEIRVSGSHIWLTRHPLTYDYWPQQGDVLCIARGERIWITNDGPQNAEVTLSSDLPVRPGWLSRLREVVQDLASPQARR